jgi:hypothetical protein
MTEVKKSLSTTIKEALAKKNANQHPDSKDSKDGGGATKKRTAPPAGTGKVMKKAAGRGR